MFFKHWSHIKASDWKYKFFTPAEIACKHDGSILIDDIALVILEKARNIACKPFYINSAYRSEYHNASVGGSARSYHLEGRAFDISLTNHNRSTLTSILEEAGFTGLGINYKNFIHADNGRKRRW